MNYTQNIKRVAPISNCISNLIIMPRSVLCFKKAQEIRVKFMKLASDPSFFRLLAKLWGEFLASFIIFLIFLDTYDTENFKKVSNLWRKIFFWYFLLQSSSFQIFMEEKHLKLLVLAAKINVFNLLSFNGKFANKPQTSSLLKFFPLPYFLSQFSSLIWKLCSIKYNLNKFCKESYGIVQNFLVFLKQINR